MGWRVHLFLHIQFCLPNLADLQDVFQYFLIYCQVHILIQYSWKTKSVNCFYINLQFGISITEEAWGNHYAKSATAAFLPRFLLPWFSADLGGEQPPCSQVDLITVWTEWFCAQALPGQSLPSGAARPTDHKHGGLIQTSRQASIQPHAHFPHSPTGWGTELERWKKGTHPPHRQKKKNPKPTHDAKVNTYNNQGNSQQASEQWLLSINYPHPNFTGMELLHGQFRSAAPSLSILPHANYVQADQLLLCN